MFCAATPKIIVIKPAEASNEIPSFSRDLNCDKITEMATIIMMMVRMRRATDTYVIIIRAWVFSSIEESPILCSAM